MAHSDCGDGGNNSRPGFAVVIAAAAVLAAVLGCTKATDIGGSGETHFLRACSAAAHCSNGLDCVCGVCTVRCDDNGDCGDQGDQAVCRPSDCSSERICDVECEEDGDCAELGSGYACENGSCRAADSESIDAGSGADANGGDASGGESPPPPPGAMCGNNVIEEGEQCDGLDLGGERCVTLGYVEGLLTCDPDTCMYDVSTCNRSQSGGECGNNVIEGDEQCDGVDLGGERCVTLGYGEGLLTCDPDTCTYDVTMCNRNQEDGPAAGPDGPIGECPAADPPYDDPYCVNPACPFSDLLDLTEENLPKGNCCNTVDVKRMEDVMAPGETYDLEMAFLSNLPLANPNLTNPLVRDVGLKGKQDVGGDLILIRIQDVPRTEDHPTDSDGNPEGIPLTMQMGAGKVNCDGTFSFYGPDSAPPPVHPEAGTPDDPGRWTPTTVPVTFYGPQGEYLYTVDEEQAAALGLKWGPRWLNNGVGIDYELPERFHFMRASNDALDSHYSCLGERTVDEEWNPVGVFWAFIPVEPIRHITTDVLLGQTICGLFAQGALSADCDIAQSEWPSQPPAYCDEATGYCWMGDSGDEYYDDFWADVYAEEDGCDETGAGDRPCCDPAGEDSNLPACNAFPYIGGVVLAAVDITDEPAGSGDDAISSISLCE